MFVIVEGVIKVSGLTLVLESLHKTGIPLLRRYYEKRAELDGRVRRFNAHAWSVCRCRPVLWMRDQQTEHRQRVPAG